MNQLPKVAQSPKSVNTPKKTLKFLIHSEFGEINDVAFALKREGHKVLVHIVDKDYRKLYDGMLDKIEEWYRVMGKGWVFVFDGCSHGDLQDWLREKGELVFGGSAKGDELENDRQKGQEWFKRIGFRQPESRTFSGPTAIDDAIDFIKKKT